MSKACAEKLTLLFAKRTTYKKSLECSLVSYKNMIADYHNKLEQSKSDLDVFKEVTHSDSFEEVCRKLCSHTFYSVSMNQIRLSGRECMPSSTIRTTLFLPKGTHVFNEHGVCIFQFEHGVEKGTHAADLPMGHVFKMPAYHVYTFIIPPVKDVVQIYQKEVDHMKKCLDLIEDDIEATKALFLKQKELHEQMIESSHLLYDNLLTDAITKYEGI